MYRGGLRSHKTWLTLPYFCACPKSGASGNVSLICVHLYVLEFRITSIFVLFYLGAKWGPPPGAVSYRCVEDESGSVRPDTCSPRVHSPWFLFSFPNCCLAAQCLLCEQNMLKVCWKITHIFVLPQPIYHFTFDLHRRFWNTVYLFLLLLFTKSIQSVYAV